jgi:valyl-tRNA synthetase
MEWVEGTRKFGNKLWNGTRFVLRSVEPGSVPADGGYPDQPGEIDAWILSRLCEVSRRFDELCDQYRFSDAFGLLYSFTWSEVFDWYLEMSKGSLADEVTASATRQTLGVVIRDVIKLFHPAIPYLTEELWMNVVDDGFVAGANWPLVPDYEGPEEMEDLQALISGVRRFRAEQGISPRTELTLRVHGVEGLPDWSSRLLTDLVAVTPEAIAEPPTDGHTRIVAGRFQGFIPLEGVIDTGAERDRLSKRIAAAQKDLDRVEKKLGNPSFIDKAPDEIVEKERGKQQELTDLIEKVQAQLDLL